ncbi:MAG: tRNA pseudouridine(55) synthase TruB [Gammaproteobacteria bacterium]
MSKRHQRPRGRNVNGILLLNKPGGITSNEALQIVKRLFRARKAGHTGSLDKMATGLLLVCFGEATKFSAFLLNADKQYRASCQLGIETATGDALGDTVKELPVPVLTTKQIEKALQQFRGAIEQIPPMYSALKHKGRRLYELAYQGIEVERQVRTVIIHHLELLGYEDAVIELSITCSKGTYIRTLAEDIGRQLGCGAHVCALRRTGVGPFNEEQMLSLPDLEELAKAGLNVLDEKLLAIDTALQDMPHVELEESIACYLCDGQPVVVPHAPTRGMLRIYSEQHDFLGVGEVLDDGRVAPKRLVST